MYAEGSMSTFEATRFQDPNIMGQVNCRFSTCQKKLQLDDLLLRQVADYFWSCFDCLFKDHMLLNPSLILNFQSLSTRDQQEIMDRLSVHEPMRNSLKMQLEQHELLPPDMYTTRQISIRQALLSIDMPTVLIEMIDSFSSFTIVQPNMQVWCLDTINRWREATVLSVKGNCAYIKSDNFSEAWNEWVEFYPQNCRLARRNGQFDKPNQD